MHIAPAACLAAAKEAESSLPASFAMFCLNLFENHLVEEGVGLLRVGDAH